MEITGSTVLVTGASGGVGQSIARTLHRRGANLILTGRNQSELDILGSQLEGARVVPCDLADRADLIRFIDGLGDVDILVANAALPAVGKIDDFSTQDIDRALDVNLRAPMVMTQSLLPGMLSRRRGHVVFISSMGGKMATARLSVYSATKYGLRGFAGSLRQDLAGTGVSASVVFPGSVIDAGMLVKAGLSAAPRTRGCTADQVGAAVVRAIDHDQGEIDVAQLMVRVIAKTVGVFPGLSDKIGQQREAMAYAEQLSDGLHHLR